MERITRQQRRNMERKELKRQRRQARQSCQPGDSSREVRELEIAQSSEVNEKPALNEMAHTYLASDIQRDGDGPLACSLGSYLGKLKRRIADGEKIKENIFLEFGYSLFSINQFMRKPVMHASGGTNIPLMHLLLLDDEETVRFLKDIEISVRGIVDDLNGDSRQRFRLVNFRIRETDEEVDPSTAFGAPKDGKISQSCEKTINYRI